MNADHGRPSQRGERYAALLAEYAEVNSNFRMLTEIRFKLLAFLPLAAAASAAAIAATRSSASSGAVDARILALSLFGLAVTIGLATYNARNDQIYIWLVSRGAAIEREIGLPDGSFSHRPNAWWEIRLGPLRWHVGHVSSVTAIYSASTSLWLFGCLLSAAQLGWEGEALPTWAYGGAIVLSVLIIISCSVKLGASKNARREDLPRVGASAIELASRFRLAGHAEIDELEEIRARAKTGAASDAELKRIDEYYRFVRLCVRLMSPDCKRDNREDEVKRRIEYFARMSHDERGSHPAETELIANYLALIVDLPTSMLMNSPRRR
jgi:hypothetical protein